MRQRAEIEARYFSHTHATPCPSLPLCLLHLLPAGAWTEAHTAFF